MLSLLVGHYILQEWSVVNQIGRQQGGIIAYSLADNS